VAGARSGRRASYGGAGYPDGLREGEIPLAGRIVFVCDAFHAMTSDRPYRQGMSEEEALELKRSAGTQFDPVVVDAFVGRTRRAESSMPVRRRRAAHLSARSCCVTQPEPTSENPPKPTTARPSNGGVDDLLFTADYLCDLTGRASPSGGGGHARTPGRSPCKRRRRDSVYDE